MKALKFLIGLTAALLLVSCSQKKDIPDAEITAIAKEAYLYGYPMVKNYKAMYASAIDAQNPEYRKPFNEFDMAPRVDTPADQNRETASNDTPYGSVWLDLRREPLVLTVPAIEDGRYYSIQFTDLYSHNFDYAGTRTSGNKGGKFLIAGPGWKGEKPEGIDRVIQSETLFAHGLVRIQLMNPEDMGNVEKIQGGFSLVPLSQFLGAEAPPEAAPLNFPVYSEEKVTTPEFFSYMNFLMQFGTPPQDEEELMKRFGKIGVGAGKSFSLEGMSESEKKAYQSGVDGAIADLDAALKGDLIKGADMHGTRADLKNNYLNRAYGVMTDQYGASPQEILSISYKLDSEFKVLSGANHYTIRFEKDKLPPAGAFWSLTLYESPGGLLVDNPVKRYYINSSMVSKMVTDPVDGSVTVFIQKDAPGSEPGAAESAVKAVPAEMAKEAATAAPKQDDMTAKAKTAKPAVQVPGPQAASLQANWLPAPEGDFYMVLRIYAPKEEALNGTWKEPVVMRFNTDAPVADGADAKAVDAKAADAPQATDGAKPAEAQQQPGAATARPEEMKPAAATPAAASTAPAPAAPAVTGTAPASAAPAPAPATTSPAKKP